MGGFLFFLNLCEIFKNIYSLISMDFINKYLPFIANYTYIMNDTYLL